MKQRLLTAAFVFLPVLVFAWQAGLAGIGITQSGLKSQIERGTRDYSESLTIPYFGAKAMAAIKGMDEAGRTALTKELCASVKTMVMSAEFQAAHDAYIKERFKAVNHGIQATSMEETAKKAMTKGNVEEFQVQMKRQMAAAYVQMAMETPLEGLKEMFESDLKDWTKSAGNPKRSDRAKYAKLVSQAQAIQGFITTDEKKFRRGYAVLKSAEADGLDTEEALFGAQQSAQMNSEQLAWDKYNLKGILKRLLTQAANEAQSVDFAAQTVQKGSVKVFVNPAYEKKSSTWKAMYRAGKAPTGVALEFARAWLKEL